VRNDQADPYVERESTRTQSFSGVNHPRPQLSQLVTLSLSSPLGERVI